MRMVRRFAGMLLAFSLAFSGPPGAVPAAAGADSAIPPGGLAEQAGPPGSWSDKAAFAGHGSANVAASAGAEAAIPVLPGPGIATPELARRAAEKSATVKSLPKEQLDYYAGVDERLGQVVPRGITVRDEDGRTRDFAEFLDKPALLAPVYFSCPATCHLLLGTLAGTLPRMVERDKDGKITGGLLPGRDYRVLSVSFDETDTPQLASRRKNNFLAALDFAYPPDGWRFLTADRESIRALMHAVGFRFKREGRDFIHPSVMMALAPGGKVTRYLYGQSFMPFDLTMAVSEAEQGLIGLSVKRMVSYCFTYDPASRKYVFNFVRVAGICILGGAGLFFLALVLAPRRKKKT